MTLHQRSCDRHKDVPIHSVVMSIDGVNETNSSSRSLQVVTIRFEGCKEIYPVVISRPEIFQKVAMKLNFETYIASLLEQLRDNDIRLEKLVLDAPERAACRKQKQHGGYYSCDVCEANPENMAIPGKRGCKYLLNEFLTYIMGSII